MHIKLNKSLTIGINDDEFLRGSVPMTKSEIRALTILKASLSINSVVWDIGAGTGSISIEAGLLVQEGKVFAIERNSEGIDLITKNAEKFGLKNIHIIEGAAPEALKHLPRPDSVIIGGSGGNLQEIIEFTWSRLSENGSIVVNAVTIETAFSAINILEKISNKKVDASLISATRLKNVGNYHMFDSQNPVFIISTVKDDICEGNFL